MAMSDGLYEAIRTSYARGIMRFHRSDVGALIAEIDRLRALTAAPAAGETLCDACQRGEKCEKRFGENLCARDNAIYRSGHAAGAALRSHELAEVERVGDEMRGCLFNGDNAPEALCAEWDAAVRKLCSAAATGATGDGAGESKS